MLLEMGLVDKMLCLEGESSHPQRDRNENIVV